MRYRILYNPLAGRISGKPSLPLQPEDEAEYQDITLIEDLAAYIAQVPSDEGIILCGGDGTIHRFINAMSGAVERDILYYTSGSGNDFSVDVGKVGEGPFSITAYLKKLPMVTVNGEKRLFINNVGYGIDGYCCEIGDKQRETSDKPVNYTSIAIKGLLGGYKPRNAKIKIDGKEYTYKKVWLAATMNGRYYGGGMNAAPAQDRLNADHTVSLVVMAGSGKLRSLMAFPSIFKGKLVEHKELCTVITGHTIDVEFDVPCALQIDGETMLNISGYHVDAYSED